MAINPDLRLKIRHFFRDHHKPFVVIAVIFLALIMINRLLLKKKYTQPPQTTYTPNISIVDSKVTSVPTEVADEFSSFIEKYVGYCNN